MKQSATSILNLLSVEVSCSGWSADFYLRDHSLAVKINSHHYLNSDYLTEINSDIHDVGIFRYGRFTQFKPFGSNLSLKFFRTCNLESNVWLMFIGNCRPASSTVRGLLWKPRKFLNYLEKDLEHEF